MFYLILLCKTMCLYVAGAFAEEALAKFLGRPPRLSHVERKEAGLVPGTFLTILKDKSNNAFEASDDAKEREMCVGGK